MQYTVHQSGQSLLYVGCIILTGRGRGDRVIRRPASKSGDRANSRKTGSVEILPRKRVNRAGMSILEFAVGRGVVFGVDENEPVRMVAIKVEKVEAGWEPMTR